MPRRPSLEPIFDKRRNRWQVNVPPSHSDSGKRTRSYHKTRDKARAFIEGLQGKTPAATIPPTLAMEADKARALLAPHNLDLVQVAQIFVEAQKLLKDTGGSLIDAAKEYRKAWESRNSSNTFGAAVTAYLDSRQNLRERTLSSYKYTLESVFKPLADMTMADITTSDLAAPLANKGATAARMHQRNLGGFWRWASKPPRSWASTEALQALETPRGSSDADIQILSPDDVKALLAAAEVEDSAAAVAYAIAVFGGVRMAELERLTWGNVKEDHIEIGKDIAKKHSRRLVPICPTLRQWIDTYRGEAESSDQIVPANWADISKSVRRRAGWAVVARLLADSPEPTRGPWPGNACRHTCASVQVAIGTTLEDLTFKFGHSGGHDILRAHYVARLTKKDAIKILRVGPNGSTVDLPGLENKSKIQKPKGKKSTK